AVGGERGTPAVPTVANFLRIEGPSHVFAHRMLRAEEEVMAQPEAVGPEAPVREPDDMPPCGGEIDRLGLLLPGDHAMKGGGGERVIPAHGAAEVRVVVMGRLARRDEGELREFYGVI